MPWRTVCEVVKHLSKDGLDAHLLSLGNDNTQLSGGYIPVGTYKISKVGSLLEKGLKEAIERIDADVIFWPVSWRESITRTTLVTKIGIPVVVWFPGGIYSVSSIFYALKIIGIRKSLPYLREVLSSKSIKVRQMKKAGVRAVLSMTETTTQSAVQACWPQEMAYTVMPGREAGVLNEVSSLTADFLSWLNKRPFYLFMGPPSGIRGINELLVAFERAASVDKDIRLVCLFRSDAVLDAPMLQEYIAKMTHTDRVYCVWQSLPKKVLNSYMAKCHAVVMPFVIVPSEIPLAIIETMAWGKPIITTSPGGTADFVRPFGLTPTVGNLGELTKALIDLKIDHELYDRKCQNVIKAYNAHPNWKEVASQWLNIAKRVVQ